MTVPVKLEVAANDSVVEVTENAISDYAKIIIEDENYYEYVDVVKAMLNYGSAAQIYFNTNTENLANNYLSDADKEIKEIDEGYLIYPLDMYGEIDTFSYIGSSLVLDSELAIRHYFTIDEATQIEDYSFSVNDEEVEATLVGSMYYIEVTSISLSDLNYWHSVEITKGYDYIHLNYNAMVYMTKYFSSDRDDNLGNLLCTLFAYNRAFVWSVSGTYAYTDHGDGTCSIDGYTGRTVGDLNIPNEINGLTVTEISPYAFSDCQWITGNIVIPDSVTMIGKYAFYNCKNAKGTLTLSQKLKTIDEYAFYKCEKLAGELQLSSEIDVIGMKAFSYCGSLKGDLVIPDGITTCDWFDHTGFDGDLILSDSMTYDESFASTSAEATNFKGVRVSENSMNYSSKDNVLYSKDYTVCIWCPKNNTCEVFISDACLKICSFAFYNTCGSMQILLPDSVTIYGESAFENCAGNIESLNLNEDTGVGEAAFNNTVVNTIVYGDISKNTFHNFAENLKFTLPENIVYTGESVILGNYGSFGDKVNGWGISGNYVILNPRADISYITNTDEMYFSALTVLYGYKDSTAESFAKEQGLIFKEITSGSDEFLSDVKTSIRKSNDSFYVYYANQLNANDMLIYNELVQCLLTEKEDFSIRKSKFTNVDLNTLDNSTWRVFRVLEFEYPGSYMMYLPFIHIDETESSYVFTLTKQPYYSLEEYRRTFEKSKELAKLVKGVDRYSTLMRLYLYMKEYTEYNAVENRDEKSDYLDTCACGVLLYNVATCSGYSNACKMICDDLQIPCISIGNAGHAWNLIQMEDGQWYSYDLSAAGVMNPDNFKISADYILGIESHEYTNQHSYSLSDFYLAEPGDFVFPVISKTSYRYTGTAVDVSDLKKIEEEDTGLTFMISDHGDGTCSVTGCKGFSSDLIIPEYINGLKVTEIATSAFSSCTWITGDITIPDSVTIIGDFAFNNCMNANGTLYLSQNITEIGDSAFSNCSLLHGTLQLSSKMTKVGKDAFLYCKTMTGDLIIPDTISNLDWFRWTGFDGELVLPANCRYYDCFALDVAYETHFKKVSVSSDNNEYSVKDNVLYSKDYSTCLWCPYDNEGVIEIPESCSKIAPYAFRETAGQKQIILSDSVKNIGRYAFFLCSGYIDELRVEGDMQMTDGSFAGLQVNTIIYEDSVSDLSKFILRLQFTSTKNTIHCERNVIVGRLDNYPSYGTSFGMDYNVVILDPEAEISFIDSKEGMIIEKSVVIYGYENSTAEAFATENSFAFREIEVDEDTFIRNYKEYLA